MQLSINCVMSRSLACMHPIRITTHHHSSPSQPHTPHNAQCSAAPHNTAHKVLRPTSYTDASPLPMNIFASRDRRITNGATPNAERRMPKSERWSDNIANTLTTTNDDDDATQLLEHATSRCVRLRTSSRGVWWTALSSSSVDGHSLRRNVPDGRMRGAVVTDGMWRCDGG